MDKSEQLRQSLAHPLVALSGGFIEKPLQVCQVLRVGVSSLGA